MFIIFISIYITLDLCDYCHNIFIHILTITLIKKYNLYVYTKWNDMCIYNIDLKLRAYFRVQTIFERLF